ncbi:MAG: helix-turn-helix transcriptional regulator [Elainellaceae cyanobacterium]
MSFSQFTGSSAQRMAIELSLNYPDAWLHRSSPNEVNLKHSDPTDTILKCPAHIGQGYSQRIPMRDGLSLMILNYEFQDEFVREIQAFTPPLKLELEFILKGPHAGQSQLVLTSGREIQSIVSRYPGNQHISKVELHLQFPILKVFLDGLLEQLPAKLQRLTTDFLEQLYSFQMHHVNPVVEQAYSLVYRSAITPKMRQVLHQILDCPYRGLNRRVYLEGKALELMTLRSQQIIEQLVHFSNPRTHQSSLQSDDLNRIYQAKEILLNNLQHPPSIHELARQVGLNRRKLNESFQQVFQMTPFEYLQDYRLTQAQRILSSSDAKIEDVIAVIGYRSRSNFAVAFRKKFGLNPKLYQQRSLRALSEKVY